jgi:hypothetical protein
MRMVRSAADTVEVMDSVVKGLFSYAQSRIAQVLAQSVLGKGEA